MTKFWGVLFGINFAMGVATGIVMEFQFGMNWSYYSHYVGDVFGAPLAIEGLMAFFLEATFVGLFFFGWDKLSKVAHLIVTWLVAIGSNFSALWILIANGWMQNPVGAAFNPQTMRMEVTDFVAVLTNPVAQAKFVHTVSAGYTVAADLRARRLGVVRAARAAICELAKRSMTVAASFGLAASLSVVVLGDESGYLSTEHQKMKIAAHRGDVEDRARAGRLHRLRLSRPAHARDALRGPYPDAAGPDRHALADHRDPGHRRTGAARRGRIRDGIMAYDALQKIREAGSDADDAANARARLRALRQRHGLCAAAQALRRRPAQGHARADRARRPGTRCRAVPPLFWSFRIMVGLGMFFIVLTATFFVLSARRRLDAYPLAAARSRCSRFRCRGSPPNWAGSWPRSAASPG